MRTTSTAFVILSFEGPDAYSSAGGLGARVSGLARALAEEGAETHLFFIGSPELPAVETDCDGRLHLHRWCQWISRYHPGGVYDGEEGKLADWNSSLPHWLEAHLLPTLIDKYDRVVVLAEEWQTSWTVVDLSARARARGWDRRIGFFWNANNTFGFDRIGWPELREAATVATVSRFMKHEMWRYGVDAIVLPNGIAPHWLEPCDRYAVAAVRLAASGRLLLTKVGRWDPNKRWLMAVEALRELRARGLRPLLIARGGSEAHGIQVVAHAQALGLAARFVTWEGQDAATLCRIISSSQSTDIVFIESALSQPQLQILYRASDGVLANSGIEPFGLVGLEAMASGGLSFLGATGEDYATPGHDAVSLQTSDPNEIVSQVLYLRQYPPLMKSMRREARKTAARFTWSRVIRTHIAPRLWLANVQSAGT